MLSFLRDNDASQQDLKTVKNTAQQNGTGGNEAQAGNEEYLTVSGHSRKVRNTTIVFAGMFVVGIACLLFMIRKSGTQTASALSNPDDQMQIEQAIAKLTNVKSDIFTGIERILGKLYDFSNVQQIQVDELSKNPFRLEATIAMTDTSNSTLTTVKARPMPPPEDFELLSIMKSGQRYCCMINDKILYEGDSIKDYRVAEISGDSVRLRANDLELLLKLE